VYSGAWSTFKLQEDEHFVGIHAKLSAWTDDLNTKFLTGIGFLTIRK